MTTLDLVRDRLRFADIRGMYLSDEERSGLDKELDQLLQSIGLCPTVESAEGNVHELDDFQSFLQLLSFKYLAELSEKQNRLVHQYDNWGDPSLRRAHFEAIKRGQFP